MMKKSVNGIVMDMTPEEESAFLAEQAAYIAGEADRLKAEEAAKAKAALVKIDLDSIRSIREWLAKRPDAPQILKDREASAIIERARL